MKGFGLYYVENDLVKKINFDIIAADAPQNARFSVRGFRILRQQQFFKDAEEAVFQDQEEKHYVVWADCGTHFRNQTVIGYLLRELADENIHGIKKRI